MEAALEGYRLALDLAEESDDDGLRCSVLNGLGEHSVRLGAFPDALRFFDQALQVARAANDLHWEGAAVGNLGQLQANLGDNRQALIHYEDQVRIARLIVDRPSEGNVLCILGVLYYAEAQPEQAREWLSESLIFAREVGYARLQATVLLAAGDRPAEALADPQGALRSYQEARALARSRNDVRSEGQFLGYFGLLQARLGNTAEARAASHLRCRPAAPVGDRISLGILLAAAAQAHCLEGDRAAADLALSEAESIAGTSGVLPGSELALAVGEAIRQAAALRESLS